MVRKVERKMRGGWKKRFERDELRDGWKLGSGKGEGNGEGGSARGR